jgi:hypothetical protein
MVRYKWTMLSQRGEGGVRGGFEVPFLYSVYYVLNVMKTKDKTKILNDENQKS